MDRRWLIDEQAYAGAEHLDQQFVASYDRKSGYGHAGGPDSSEELARLQAHGVGREATVIDLGAGTGQFALAAAFRFRRVVAVDISPAMVESLAARAAALAGVKLECVQAGFLSYNHIGPRADAVHTRNALHHLPDFWKAIALERIGHMLRPGGLLRLHDLIYDFAPADAEAVFERWLASGSDDPSKGYTAEDFAMHIRSEYSTFRWLFEPLLAVSGFDIVTAEFRNHVYGTYTCRRTR
ncbi:MAG: class I SAM-dependent methyltransferase [Candidatus Nephthysia bennettiae]|uniref:Class I SAM-dependent methyltransferase n=1 Tax=Candidatus Nephthysia bennettiae TaxID=3127016 RepID=A0A934K7G8_9BACT|nr:class I SAM-dependent methyltransferase [Candidatus Dormibacteraeota bacterium]MBJ7613643.1 class I SAM-dependent methyltransferase [Candidatus Dormibacteraeota bacterium]PZS00150.1 MAG: class I SAM-dependent methyltransferase [Candidatus Dormibacteraeota bacterium]